MALIEPSEKRACNPEGGVQTFHDTEECLFRRSQPVMPDKSCLDLLPGISFSP